MVRANFDLRSLPHANGGLYLGRLLGCWPAGVILEPL